MDDKLDALIERMDAIIAGLQFMNVTLMRLYDVESAALADRNSTLWEQLDKKHEDGTLHNGFPYLREDVFDNAEDAS